MNIEIGEYVRTKAGDITKITRFCELEFNGVRINSIVGEDGCLFGNPDKVVKKHSKSIISLIETGDYVNGKKVVSVGYGGAVNVEGFKFIKPNDIKSIVTREQFFNMEYKV